MKPGDLVKVKRYYHPDGPEFGVIINESETDYHGIPKFQILWDGKEVPMFSYEVEHIDETR